MAEQGHVVTTSKHISDGFIRITPGTKPSFGVARQVWHTKHINDKKVAGSEDLYVEVKGKTLVIHLNPKKKLEGLHIVWTSFD